MDPITLCVNDKNVCQALSPQNQSWKDSLSESPTYRQSIGKSMFPTNIKYIFDGEEICNKEDDAENVIILEMSEGGQVESVEMISDDFELLRFKNNGENPLLDTTVQGNKLNIDLELDVVSKFRELSEITADLSLEELVNVYKIQNEQLRSIYNSIMK
ncbi:Atg31p KNAG_0H01360 [Huiozyma naganishii CBS 8797]|uniref:Autophagy-related protein 31 n=1 Tax=Huiozyma naganishii (strain ATCC MYA-139 / BCRC 22969 / CBS 8797 / KCTC 17520 / NBRC 10181 / NCYC 3082 / Yp74L-3) TaxID=1071383 RepID=J7S8I0_HUIN7|nr:hypothetical protein KNAG_0H01360 [Kazachstania naganishii CBS 8797]CCK71549.1 hypothetical protein KNAG_0H01360 [Kazachstania naganishii CBS 8797]